MCMCRFGFQTPEGWNTYDHYRSLCYMRPLAIWAMQWALSKPKLHNKEMKQMSSSLSENSSYVKQDAGFQEVACLLKLPKQPSTSYIQSLHQFLCNKFSIWLKTSFPFPIICEKTQIYHPTLRKDSLCHPLKV